ncbi:MAG TPA: tRNA pseudouridine(55) synthase TruB [Terriglobia bacterium]|nr:tRNA pseudouridine(55) synthase TruB [Terriglobia bacterium]
MNGIIVVDKPEGKTSHGVILRLRATLRIARAGHLGTLDPMATGVLPVPVGRATRIGRFLPSGPKEYVGSIRLGFATTTYDRQGTPTSPETPFHGGTAEIVAAAAQLTGTLEQVPPPFSAKKIDGKRSYKLARRGVAVTPAAARVTVETFEVGDLDGNVAPFRVVCSAGTYVRSLAHDLGGLLGCGAHLTALRRLRSGPFTIDEARPLDQITVADIIPMERLLLDWPLLEVDTAGEIRVAHGNPVECSFGEGMTRIFNKKGEFIAVADIESGWAHPRVVLTSTAQVESSEMKA